MSHAHNKQDAPPMVVAPSHTADIILHRQPVRSAVGKLPLIAIGSSTGGTEALRVLLTGLPPDMPPIVVTQHMPEMFTKSFATRLDALCRLKVKEAEDGERLQSGTVYIAPGHSHLLVKSSNGIAYAACLHQGPPVNRHKPSVDVLFRSAANVAGKHCIGVILTGMGRDGAAGMVELREAGAINIAQDEASCVVFGMPKEAIASGGVHEILPLQNIASRLIALCAGR